MRARGLCGTHYRRASGRDRGAHKRAHNVKARYGLTIEQYDAIIARGCEICGSRLHPHLDHDHATGAARGCLCKLCNSALARIEHVVGWCEKAHVYLQRGAA